jgi:hypothetical protein
VPSPPPPPGPKPSPPPLRRSPAADAAARPRQGDGRTANAPPPLGGPHSPRQPAGGSRRKRRHPPPPPLQLRGCGPPHRGGGLTRRRWLPCAWRLKCGNRLTELRVWLFRPVRPSGDMFAPRRRQPAVALMCTLH